MFRGLGSVGWVPIPPALTVALPLTNWLSIAIHLVDLYSAYAMDGNKTRNRLNSIRDDRCNVIKT